MPINNVTIIGNLTRDVELRSLPSGSTVADLGVAVNGREKRGDEWEERADFFDVTVFGKTAENCERYLSKGSRVGISGRLRQDRWTNDAGENRSKVKIVAFEVQFLTTRDDASQTSPQPSSDVPGDDAGLQAAPTAQGDSDIPF